MKRAISLILTLAIVLCMSPGAFAASSEANEAADALHNLGLFNGTGTDANGKPIYDLDRAPSRAEAVTMLVRLLGKESEATAGKWETPFTDVQDWAKPYVGYAYVNKLTSGTGATTFSGNDTVTASQYLTFVLRALGYESGTDFQWDKAWELSNKISLTNSEYSASTNTFLRSDIAEISLSALPVAQKNSTQTLAQKLIADSVFTQELYDQTILSAAPAPDTTPFTLTAFGDKELHEYLLSLNPSEQLTRLNIHFDSYWYSDQFFAEEFGEKLKDMYTFVQIVPAKESGGTHSINFAGTRVETVEDPIYGRFIGVSTFGADGSFTSVDYYIRARTDR